MKRLRKPSAAAWAVNQASRSQPKDRRALLAAAEELRRTQDAILAGNASARDLESAVGRHRAAVDSLVDAAAGLLSGKGSGPSGSVLERVRETLNAVPTDPELAELVDAGTLDRERRAAGFGGLAAPAKPPRRDAKKGSPKKDAQAAEKRAAAERKKTVRAARDAAKGARAAEREATKRLTRAEQAAKKAHDELESARAEHEAAERSAVEADSALERVRAS